MTMYEIHMLMNYPANCLNRDDTGTPKTVLFNGAERIRISSQCLKRAWRTSPLFRNAFGEIACRTRLLPELVADELKKKGRDEEMIRSAKKVISTDKKRKKDASEDDPYLMDKMEFYSPEEVRMIADAVETAYDADPAKFKKLSYADISGMCKDQKAGITIDQAMFGRMVTDQTVGEIDAAVQVAHAMSVNAASMESDYFVAVDDLLALGEKEGPSSVGHMNTTDYDSSCFYEHVVIDMDQLIKNLKDSDEAKAYLAHICSEMVKVMAFTSPSARQNSFEAHVVPEVIYVEQKDEKIPVNLCNAFAEPSYRNVAAESVRKLADEADRMESVFGLKPKHAVWLKTRESYATPKSDDITIVSSITELMNQMDQWSAE